MNTDQNPAERRAFVLDTNVVMHDPAAIFRFEEHDIFIPMTVLEELDAGKKGVSEAARNVRQVSRFLDELMAQATKEQIDQGLELPSGRSGNHGKRPPTGRLFFQTRRLDTGLPDTLPGHGADNSILGYALALQREIPESRVTLVSKDINLRIKAAILGVHAEDYYSDRTIEDADLLFRGVSELPADFWETYPAKLQAVTAEDVQRVCRKYLGEGRIQIIAVGEAKAIVPVLAKHGPVLYYNDDIQPIDAPSQP